MRGLRSIPTLGALDEEGAASLAFEPKAWHLEEHDIVDEVEEQVRLLARQRVDAAKERLAAAGEEVGRLDDLPAELADAIVSKAGDRMLLELHLQRLLE